MNTVLLQEKQKLLSAMNEKKSKLEQEKQAKEALAQKIQAMESKLLCGGKNIVDHTNEQQRALEQKRKEIGEQKVKVVSSSLFHWHCFDKCQPFIEHCIALAEISYVS